MDDKRSSDEDIFSEKSFVKESDEGENISDSALKPSPIEKFSISVETEPLQSKSRPRTLGRLRRGAWRGVEGVGMRMLSARVLSGRTFSGRALSARITSARARAAASGDKAKLAVGWRQRTHLRNIAREHLEDLFARYYEENNQLRLQRNQLQQELRTVGARYLYLRLQSLNTPLRRGAQTTQGHREAQQLQEAQKQRLRALVAEQQALRRRAQKEMLQRKSNPNMQLSLRNVALHVRAIRVTHPFQDEDGDEVVEPISIQQLELDRLRAQISERRKELGILRRGLVDDRRALLALREQVRLKRHALAADVRAIRWHRAQLMRVHSRRRSPSRTFSPNRAPTSTNYRTTYSVARTYSIPSTYAVPRTYSIHATISNSYENLIPAVEPDLETALLPAQASDSDFSTTFTFPTTSYEPPNVPVTDSDTILVPATDSTPDCRVGSLTIPSSTSDSHHDLATTIDSDPETVLQVPATTSNTDTASLLLTELGHSNKRTMQTSRLRNVSRSFRDHSTGHMTRSAPAVRKKSNPKKYTFRDILEDPPSEGTPKKVRWRNVSPTL